MIWKHEAEPEGLNTLSKNTMVAHLGIEFTDVGKDYLEATMPVDAGTVQPFGILHGGASVALAETLGSVAATLCIEDRSRYAAVGIEVNASHLRSVPRGRYVTGRATPARIGGRIQVWDIDIRDPDGRLVCKSRLTMAVIERASQGDSD